MRVVTQDRLGGPEVLHTGEAERPTPGVGEILVEVHAAGVNPVDAMQRQTGTFGGPPPFTIGWDVSGVVAAIGPGVTLYAPGDEVFGMLPFPRGAGAYAEFAVGPPRAFVRKPETLSHVEAAALPLSGLTAWQALVDTANVTAGTRVLLTGASGGVGHLALQIARSRGAHIVAVASGEHADAVRAWGADEIIDYRTTDVATAATDIDVALEVIGGEYPARVLRTVRAGGILVSTLPPSLAPIVAAASERGVRLAGLFVESDQLGMRGLADLATRDLLRPRIAATYPLSDAASAHARRHGPGKVVLTVR